MAARHSIEKQMFQFKFFSCKHRQISTTCAFIALLIYYDYFNFCFHVSKFQALVACYVVADCGPRLKYTWGDALQGTDCPGPDGTPYPR